MPTDKHPRTYTQAEFDFQRNAKEYFCKERNELQAQAHRMAAELHRLRKNGRYEADEVQRLLDAIDRYNSSEDGIMGCVRHLKAMADGIRSPRFKRHASRS